MMRFADLAATDALAERARDELFPGRPILKVARKFNGPKGFCYQNVRNFVRYYGGQSCLGWTLCHWPNGFVEALHHAVWRDASGHLWDVTDHAYAGLCNETIAFIEGVPQMPLGNVDPTVPALFLHLTGEPAILHYAELTRERTQLMGAWNAHLQKVGTRKVHEDGQVTYAAPRDPTIDYIKSRCDRILHIRQAYEAQFSEGNLSKIV